MGEYDEAFERAVANWLNAHEAQMGLYFSHALEKVETVAIRTVADELARKMGRFLDQNRDALVTAIAAAIAACWQSRQHPIPGMQGGVIPRSPMPVLGQSEEP
jgi:hypothetical protein